MEELVAEQVPLIKLFNFVLIGAHKTNVHGYATDKSMYADYGQTYVVKQ